MHLFGIAGMRSRCSGRGLLEVFSEGLCGSCPNWFDPHDCHLGHYPVVAPTLGLVLVWKMPKANPGVGPARPDRSEIPRQFLCICVRAICPILVIPANILSWILWSYNTSNMTCENLATFEPELCGHLSWRQPYGAGFSASECCIWPAISLKMSTGLSCTNVDRRTMHQHGDVLNDLYHGVPLNHSFW